MTSNQAWYRTTKDGIIISVWLQPRASRAKVIGLHGDALKVAVTAPPLADRANQQCLKLLSKAVDKPKGQLKIISGRTGRHKQILISGATTADVNGILPK